MRALVAFVPAALRISVPYVLAALGGSWSERSGVINLALEGLLLGGAFAATLAAWASHSGLVGVLAGAGAGIVLAALYGLLVLRFAADQIVTGVALNLLVDGLTRFCLKAVFDSSSNSPRVDAFSPVLAPALIGVTLALVALSELVLSRTAFGLRVRAVGEHPDAAASLGLRPLRVRAVAVLL